MKETVLTSSTNFQKTGKELESPLSFEPESSHSKVIATLRSLLYFAFSDSSSTKSDYLKNEDDECFKWAITRALNPVEKKTLNVLIKNFETSKFLNWEGLKFPVNLSDINKFENHNSSISVMYSVTKIWFILLE